MQLPIRLMLVGASGAVGRAVLAQALADARVGEVVALTRRPLARAPKLNNVVLDLAQLPANAPWWQVDSVICTLGTTIRAAGSQAQFAAIDRDLVLRVAHLARAAGASSFALNSSMGADPTSGNFYLRTKGETEALIGALDYPGLTIVRPALIDTRRAQARPGERIGLLLAHVLRPLLPARWRAVTPEAIARALLGGALARVPHHNIVESDRLHGAR